MNRPIFLYGAPASGKSTLALRLANRLGSTAIDLDAEIVAHAGRSIPEIFSTGGEVAFRKEESLVLRQVLETLPSGAVVALGGGSLLDGENRALCEQSGDVICLDPPSDAELARRLGLAPGCRPLGNRAAERREHYASFPRRIATSFELGDSLILLGGDFASLVLQRFPTVADGTVAYLHSSRLARFVTLPSGEQNKTPFSVMRLWREFAALGLGRRDVVAACGGGVTGDLTGFAAATWMRGIAWVNVPTTLLSMVDASVGGKTGCDLPEGKNLAGAFHSPKLVAIDTTFLSTLPAALLADGRAEMIKHELIGGLSRSSSLTGVPTAREIAENLMVKVDAVREDPLELNGRRLLLNCGHTVAHAIESATNYRLSHGSAVAIGCVEEARLAARLKLADANWPNEVAERFSAAGLPTQIPEDLDFETLIPLMRGDKKRAGNVVTFALPCGWGDVRACPVNLAAGELS